MREIKVDHNWHISKTRRTDFTKEEMLDIIDFYLQYKPLLDKNTSNHEDYLPYAPRDFTQLLFMYDMFYVLNSIQIPYVQMLHMLLAIFL